MHTPQRPTLRDFVAGAIIGAVLGTIILGVGGRIAMRIIGMLQGLPPGFSFGGTMTVVFLGLVSGVVGGLLLVFSRKLFPRSRIGRGAVYWGVLLLLTLKGLHPIDPLRLLVFLPVVAAFGATLLMVWCRVYLRRVGEAWPRGIRERLDASLPGGRMTTAPPLDT